MEKHNFKCHEIRSKTTLYSIHKLIGTGRFSCVYQATDMSNNDTVMVKVLINQNSNSSSHYHRYLNEMSILFKLQSNPLRSHYVNLRDTIILHPGKICFVMERLGTTLKNVIYNKGRLPMPICRVIVRQIVQGLAGLKCMGIIHADIKPDNIMFCAGNGNNHQIKIIDFSSAFYMKDAHHLTCNKFQAIPYRAPEVCFQRHLDYGIDLWALGCIVPEMVTGIKLFDVTNEELLVKMIIAMLGVPKFLIYNSEHEINSDETKPSLGWAKFMNLNASIEDINNPQNVEDNLWLIDLVYKLLSIMPDERITAVEALSHPFLTMEHFIKFPSTRITKENLKIMKTCKLNI